MKLDLGCGKNKREGFLGVDTIAFGGVDILCDLRETTWCVKKESDLINKSVPLFATNNGDEVGEAYLFPDDSVEEVHCSHFLEHLTGAERVHFYNELYRVMKKGAKAQIIAPHWASGRAYGDPTHQWPPVVEMSFFYLDKAWREVNAPHCGLTCDFSATWGFILAPIWQTKHQETQMFALTHYREVAMDIIATIEKR